MASAKNIQFQWQIRWAGYIDTTKETATDLTPGEWQQAWTGKQVTKTAPTKHQEETHQPHTPTNTKEQCTDVTLGQKILTLHAR